MPTDFGTLVQRDHADVQKELMRLLDPTATRSLTLVTCYPFYYVGAAPQRFIVRAVLAGDRSVGVLPVGPRSPVS